MSIGGVSSSFSLPPTQPAFSSSSQGSEQAPATQVQQRVSELVAGASSATLIVDAAAEPEGEGEVPLSRTAYHIPSPETELDGVLSGLSQREGEGPGFCPAS